MSNDLGPRLQSSQPVEHHQRYIPRKESLMLDSPKKEYGLDDSIAASLVRELGKQYKEPENERSLDSARPLNLNRHESNRDYTRI